MADAKYLGGNSRLQRRLGDNQDTQKRHIMAFPKTYKFAENTPLFILLPTLFLEYGYTQSFMFDNITSKY